MLAPAATIGIRLCQRIDLTRSNTDAALQELGAEPRVRAEHQARLAVDDARVEVGHRHRRGAQRRLAVDLGLVLAHQLLVVGAQELAAHRETAEAANLFDSRLLQQVERVAARTDEDEPGVIELRCVANGVPRRDAPQAVLALQAR